ncbi:MAG: hypothetical protein H6Q89_3878, partial [Myxococcaceae bacterium]|nr:hypothetical protein [Myxococcaceae bacterium]
MSRIALLGLLLLPLAASSASAVKPAPPAKAPPAAKPASGPVVATETDFPLGPMPPGPKVAWTHAPYQDGDCSLCHERKDPKSPGKLFAPVNEVCLSCHEEFAAVLGRGHVHRPTKKSCSNCHNAHNSPEKKLLHAEVPKLCAGCHDETLKEISTSKVKHAAVERDRKCLNCHNAHGSSFEQLLVKAPFDLCV